MSTSGLAYPPFTPFRSSRPSGLGFLATSIVRVGRIVVYTALCLDEALARSVTFMVVCRPIAVHGSGAV